MWWSHLASYLPRCKKSFVFFSSVRAMFPNNSPPATSIVMRASSSIHELSCLFIILLTNISTLPPSSTLTLLKWNTRSIETIRLSLAQVSLPPKATPCLARSLQTGSTTQGPSILIFPGPPPRLVPSIISAPFSFHRVPTKAANQKKSQKKRGRRIQLLPCRTVLARGLPFVPGHASPRLVSPTNPTLFSEGTTAPKAWGMGVVLTKAVYS